MRPVNRNDKENPDDPPENLSQIITELKVRVTQAEQALSEQHATIERLSRQEEAFDSTKDYARQHLLRVLRIGPTTLRWWKENGLEPVTAGMRQELYIGSRVKQFWIDHPDLGPAPDLRRKKTKKQR
jgi:hypothetical protein